MTATRVEVRAQSIERARRKCGGNDLWVVLATADDALDEFARAAAELNDANDGTDTVWAEAPSRAPNGLAVLLTHCADGAALQSWVAAFAATLGRRGLSGRLQPVATPRPPAWFAGLSARPTAFVSYVLDLDAVIADPNRTSHWHVPPVATAAITGAADRWARLPDARLEVRQNLHRAVVDLEDTAPVVARALLETGMAGLQFTRDTDRHATHVSFAPGGEGVFHVVSGSDGRTAELHHLRQALLGAPEHAQQGYVRWGPVGSLGLDALDSVQPLPGLQEPDVRYNKHLLDRYLPDAHGLQLVRSAHLDAAADLSDWRVTEVADDRFLVEAPDLAVWYAHDRVDAGLLARARRDFAGALLTRDVIAANPTPW